MEPVTTTRPTLTFDIDILAVNDAPVFTLASNAVVFEDGEVATIEDFYTGADEGGGPDENGQELTLDVSNDNNALFSQQPSIDGAGTLTFQTAANANGDATVTVILSDDGGELFGGTDASAQTFTIAIGPLNDAPVATLPASPDQSVLEDSGATNVSDFLTDVGPGGGPDESAQIVSLDVSSSNAALFSAPPSIDEDGALHFTPAANANGSSTVTLTLVDDGLAGPGHENTTVFEFVVDVTSVNDQPTFTPGLDVAVDENTGTTVLPGWATGISAGPEDESDQVAAFTLDQRPARIVQRATTGKPRW